VAGADADYDAQDGEGGTQRKQMTNSDFRNSLLPFLQKRQEAPTDAGNAKKKKKKKRAKARGADDSDDDSDAEPAAPITLDKNASDAASGLVLRKQKTKTTKKQDSSLKIKF